MSRRPIFHGDHKQLQNELLHLPYLLEELKESLSPRAFQAERGRLLKGAKNAVSAMRPRLEIEDAENLDQLLSELEQCSLKKLTPKSMI